MAETTAAAVPGWLLPVSLCAQPWAPCRAAVVLFWSGLVWSGLVYAPCYSALRLLAAGEAWPGLKLLCLCECSSQLAVRADKRELMEGRGMEGRGMEGRGMEGRTGAE